MNFDIPADLAAYLTELDEFIDAFGFVNCFSCASDTWTVEIENSSNTRSVTGITHRGSGPCLRSRPPACTVPASIIWCCPTFSAVRGGWEILAESELTLQEETHFVAFDVDVTAVRA